MFPNIRGIDACFDVGKNLAVYEHEQGNIKDLSPIGDVVDYWLNNEGQRIQMRDDGHAHVLQNHTFKNRVEQMIKTIELEGA